MKGNERLQCLISELNITPENARGGELIQGREAVIAYLRGRFRQFDFDVLNGSYIDVRIEKEQTTGVAINRDPTGFLWTDSIEDVYENSGLVRIRTKSTGIRLNIKIPLFEQDTPRVKVCWRIDIKARNAEQEVLFQQMRMNFLMEDNHELVRKYGTRVSMTDGKEPWLDRDDNDNYWIEVNDPDYPVEEKLPIYLVYLGHRKL